MQHCAKLFSTLQYVSVCTHAFREKNLQTQFIQIGLSLVFAIKMSNATLLSLPMSSGIFRMPLRLGPLLKRYEIHIY